MSRIRKSIRRERWLVISRGYGWGESGVWLLIGMVFFGGERVNTLNLNGSDDVQVADYIKNNELHTLKRWALWYVSYSSMKILWRYNA